MESSVGYSEGQGTRIATHAVDMGSEVLHHQRFAVGTGVLNLIQALYPGTVVASSDFLSCLGAGRIVISPFCSTVGMLMRVHFFGANGLSIGMSEEIEVTELASFESYALTPIGWTASKTTPANDLLRISSNSHVYMNVSISGDNYVGGVTGATEPTWPTDESTVVDGTVIWKDLGVYTGLYSVPLLVFSNSLGASYYQVQITTPAGTTTIFTDAI